MLGMNTVGIGTRTVHAAPRRLEGSKGEGGELGEKEARDGVVGMLLKGVFH